MPGRLPVDGKRVIEHRITLGTKERQLLEGYTDSQNFQNVADPIVKLLSDVTALGTIFAATYYIFPKLWENPVTGEPYDLDLLRKKEQDGGLSDYFETQNLLAIGIGAGLAWSTGGLSLIPSILAGVIGGTVVAEGAEEVFEDTVEAKRAAQRQTRFIRMALAMGFDPNSER
jgi:hypothetical protein